MVWKDKESLAEVLELDILNGHSIWQLHSNSHLFYFSHLTNCALAGQIYRTGLLNSY